MAAVPLPAALITIKDDGTVAGAAVTDGMLPPGESNMTHTAYATATSITVTDN